VSADERARRVGRNEALFRDVNERIQGLHNVFATVDETIGVVCECGELTCVDQIHVSIADYEHIRAESELFVIVPGHEKPDVEEVVERSSEYIVVRKLPGEPERIAEETDPRG
jgi:hypothetical protein